MATRQILRWTDDAVLWEGEADTIKDAIHQALATGADLWGANLRNAKLSGARDMRLPTGETSDAPT